MIFERLDCVLHVSGNRAAVLRDEVDTIESVAGDFERPRDIALRVDRQVSGLAVVEAYDAALDRHRYRRLHDDRRALDRCNITAVLDLLIRKAGVLREAQLEAELR